MSGPFSEDGGRKLSQEQKALGQHIVRGDRWFEMANKDYHVVLQVELTLRAPSESVAWDRANRIEELGWLAIKPKWNSTWIRDRVVEKEIVVEELFDVAK